LLGDALDHGKRCARIILFDEVENPRSVIHRQWHGQFGRRNVIDLSRVL
jgi:hypothetical protein